MGFIEEHKVTLTTDGAGAGSAETSVLQNASLKAVKIVYDAATAGCVTTISTNGSTVTAITGNSDLFNGLGIAPLDASGNPNPQLAYEVPIANSSITVSMTGGGATKSHVLTFYVVRGN